MLKQNNMDYYQGIQKDMEATTMDFTNKMTDEVVNKLNVSIDMFQKTVQHYIDASPK